MKGIRSYALVTGAYWGFTLTDGALRMLVVLHFYKLGYGDITIAFLFLFYEFFGIVTNLLGGWIASRSGLKTTLYGGLALQIFALLMLGLLQPSWARILSVAYVMAAQALSGIAKDLTKMSAKSAIKLVVPDDTENTLFKWVSRLTGSKNALKGAGFFVGSVLLSTLGFIGALVAMAAGLSLCCSVQLLPCRRRLAARRRRLSSPPSFQRARQSTGSPPRDYSSLGPAMSGSSWDSPYSFQNSAGHSPAWALSLHSGSLDTASSRHLSQISCDLSAGRRSTARLRSIGHSSC